MKRQFITVALLALAVPALAGVTYTDKDWELVTTATDLAGNNLGGPQKSQAACYEAIRKLPTPIRQRTDRCQQKTVTRVKVDPLPPPPAPVDCVVSDWSAWQASEWSACSNGVQTRNSTRSRTVTTQPSNGGAACPSLTESTVESRSCTVEPPPPAGDVAFTDLDRAPACAKVTAYDANRNVLWTKQAADAGVPIIDGRCLEYTPATFNAAAWAAAKPGDVITLRAGTYTKTFGEGTWYFGMGETYKKGTAAQPIAVVAAPGELVTLKPSSRPAHIFGNGDRATEHAEYLTFAGLSILAGESCISGGGHTTNPSGGPDETGGRFIRLAAIKCTITDRSSNTMTGLIDLQADGWKILGPTLRDPANRTVINNNHGIYLQGGADDVEVAYADIAIHGGAQIQIHQDGTPKLMERVNLHDNFIHATNYGDARGISVINIDNASTITSTRDRITHQGQGDWGCMALYRGNITIESLDCTDTQGPAIGLNGQYGGTRKVLINNSRLCGAGRIGAENGASLSQATETNPVSCK